MLVNLLPTDSVSLCGDGRGGWVPGDDQVGQAWSSTQEIQGCRSSPVIVIFIVLSRSMGESLRRAVMHISEENVPYYESKVAWQVNSDMDEKHHSLHYDVVIIGAGQRKDIPSLKHHPGTEVYRSLWYPSCPLLS